MSSGRIWSPRDASVRRQERAELGGSNDIASLFPEPGSGPANYHVKDKLENKLHALVCAGSITLRAARGGIRHHLRSGESDPGSDPARRGEVTSD